jgi:DNA integrity scanning protein DisA with diadenylate cyclase activity
MMKASSWLTLLPRISLRNIFEIAIISFLVYEILFWIKNTRAWTLLKGLLVIDVCLPVVGYAIKIMANLLSNKNKQD